MPTAVRIMRIRGVDVRIDPTWIVVFALLTWGLGSAFVALHPTWSPVAAVIVGAFAALLFFASVLVHEASHTVMARAWGIPVRDITLHVFGGLSSIECEPPTPKAEIWMAIIGPIVSVTLSLLALGAGALVVALTLPSGDLSAVELARRIGPVETTLFWLAGANLLVGLFNLLPGLPLDGGRVLRAVLWASSGNLQRATRTAALVGQIIGWLLVATGLYMSFGGTVPILGSGLIGGLWIALIGWIVRTAAVHSFRGAVLEDLLDGVRASDVMRVESPAVPADMLVDELVDRMLMRDGERAFPVFEGRRFAGLVALSDVRRVDSDERDTTPVRDIMTSGDRLLLGSEDEPLIEALRKMRRADVSQLPVFGRDGSFAGMLFERDVTRWIELYAGVEPPISRKRPRAAGIVHA